MRRIILVASGIAISLLVLFNLRKLSYLYRDGNGELWTVVFGGAFVLVGLIVSRVFFKTRAEVSQELPDTGESLEKFGITQREYEVLGLVAKGLSNQEISKELFISESTVKTHVSNLMTKLDARRRTQAVQKAKDVGLI